jgi:hypothetical protein
MRQHYTWASLVLFVVSYVAVRLVASLMSPEAYAWPRPFFDVVVLSVVVAVAAGSIFNKRH